MNMQLFLQKAQEYIGFEQNSFFRDQVVNLISENNIAELGDRFYTELEFGTGGLRGVIGGGYNRMNPFVVRKSTQGLANYIKKSVHPKDASVVIAYDSRNFSDLFAFEAALVLCANGIRTWLFTGLRPTPELSFAVRRLKAAAGIVVTASHNPPEYNGYKVYWNDGAQVVSPHDKGIIQEVRAVKEPAPPISREDAIDRKLLVMIDKEIDDAFIAMVKGCALRPDLIRQRGKDLKVVFTPLNGAGAMPVSRALGEMGIEVIFVPEQRYPDGNFPTTVGYPNPEEASAMRLALELGSKVGADLVMGTDPDADRLGIAVPDGGEFKLITGNQLGSLLAEYIISTRKEMGTLPENAVFVKTIVTTELQRLISQDFGVQCIDTLTGFKWIGEKIRQFESAGGPVYIGGGEESYGYLLNTEVRDKDAVSAATMTAEMALYFLSQGKTLWDQLRNIWQKYGYFEEVLISNTFKGESGLHAMNDLMEKIRNNPPCAFAGQDVIMVKDYRDGTIKYVKEKAVGKEIDLPLSNVVQFVLADRSIVTARPSGTEPKIKFYASCSSNPGEELNRAQTLVRRKIEAIREALKNLIGD